VSDCVHARLEADLPRIAVYFLFPETASFASRVKRTMQVSFAKASMLSLLAPTTGWNQPGRHGRLVRGRKSRVRLG
jgi:hypothetical protein